MKPATRHLFGEYQEANDSCNNRRRGVRKTMKHKNGKVSRRIARKFIQEELWDNY